MIIIPTTITMTITINMTQMKVRLKTFVYLHNVSILNVSFGLGNLLQ